MLTNLARPPPRLCRASPFSPQTTSSPGSPAPTSASIVLHLLKGPRGAPRTAAILTTLGAPTGLPTLTPSPQPSGPSNAAKSPGRSRGWPLSMVAWPSGLRSRLRPRLPGWSPARARRVAHARSLPPPAPAAPGAPARGSGRARAPRPRLLPGREAGREP